MSSPFVRYISAIRTPRPWLPSSLTLSRPLGFLRTYSWSSQSQPANWSHLNNIYGNGVDVNPKGLSMSPEERWYMLSRSRTATSTLPKGTYAGKVVLCVEFTVISCTCLGRSIEVKNGNVAEALNQLQYTLGRNRVSRELRLTARHEKKGYKRRRLNSERWRRRFAHEVLAISLLCDVSDHHFLGTEKGAIGEQDSCSRRIDYSLPFGWLAVLPIRFLNNHSQCCALRQTHPPGMNRLGRVLLALVGERQCRTMSTQYNINGSLGDP